LLAVVGAGLALSDRSTGTRARGAAWMTGAVAVYAVISVIFGICRPHLILAAFNDPVFLGHQARELATHAIASVPLGIFACAVLAEPGRIFPSRNTAARAGIVFVSLSIALGIYIVAGALLTGADKLGQSSDIRVLIFPHFLEHALGYFVFLTLAPAVFLTASAIPR